MCIMVEQTQGAQLRSVETRWRLCALLVILTMLVMCPAADDPLALDDFGHRVRVIDRRQLPRQVITSGFVPSDSGTLWGSLRDMHSFVRSDEQLRQYMDYGLCPWWTSPRFRAANFRPLDSFSHWLDYRLWPDRPVPMHLHSLLWFMAGVVLLALLYQRMLLPWTVAAVAGILYVIDDSNYFPVMWIANRNLPHALFFALCAILTHIHWRQSRSRWSAVTAPLFLLLSLLSTEAGLATMAYLVAYALFLDEGPWRRRMTALAPATLVIVAWRLLYNQLGFGAAGGGFIVDPVREPWAFLNALYIRGPILLSGLFGPQPAEMYTSISPGGRIVFLAISLVFLILLGIALWPLLRRNRVARFWGGAMLLCIVPICATSPMNRNLLFAAIGAFALLSMFIVGLMKRHSWLGRGRPYRALAWTMCVCLLVIHVPLALVGRVVSARLMPVAFKVFYSTIEVPADVSLAGKTLVAVNAPHPYMFVGLPCIYAWRGETLPDRIRVAAPGFADMQVMRVGPRSLVISSRQGNLFTVHMPRQHRGPHFAYLFEDFAGLFRAHNQAFEAGQVIHTPPMTTEVLSIDANRTPTAIRVTFDMDLEDESLVWLAWQWGHRGTGHYVTFELPRSDEAVVLDGPR